MNIKDHAFQRVNLNYKDTYRYVHNSNACNSIPTYIFACMYTNEIRVFAFEFLQLHKHADTRVSERAYQFNWPNETKVLPAAGTDDESSTEFLLTNAFGLRKNSFQKLRILSRH